MTLADFLTIYGGNHCITIKPYCEECQLEEILAASWWDEIQGRTITGWQTIGGGMYKTEICITLGDA